MANWTTTIYDSLAAAETAIEVVDSTKFLHIFAFKDGAHDKVGVVNRT
jgi:hypothetical protein